MEEGIAVAVGGRAGASGVVDGIEKYRGGATANMHAGEMWVAREGWAREKVPNALLPLYTPTAMQKTQNKKQLASCTHTTSS
jgi:hypothetical protein